MSKKETIEDRVRSLAEKEEQIKLQIDVDSEEIKNRAFRVGKIILISTTVAAIGYWVFNLFFEEDEKPKKKKKKSRETGITSRITALALPYLEKIVDGVINGGDDENKNEE